MRGHDALVQARLERWPVGGVDIGRDLLPGFDRRGRAFWFYLRVEEGEAGALDLRGCHRLPVFVYAESYEAGYPIFERAMEFEPALLSLCAPEVVVQFDGERFTQWEI